MRPKDTYSEAATCSCCDTTKHGVGIYQTDPRRPPIHICYECARDAEEAIREEMRKRWPR